VNVGIAVLGLAFLILVHEAGHFFVARAVGMSPRKFYVGFPPALAKVRRNGIEYGIGTIPLGGYVKIPGMHRPAPSDADAHFGRALEEAPALGTPVGRLRAALAEGDMLAARARLPEVERALAETELSPAAAKGADKGLRELADALGADAYWRQRTWKRIAVIVAGPATNLVLAVVLFAVLLTQGAWQVGVRLEADADGAVTTRVAEVVADTPAQEAGLRAGDRIVAVDGARVDADGLLQRIGDSKGAPLVLTVERGGGEREVGPVRPRERPGLSGPAAVGRSLEVTWEVTKAIGGFLPRLVTGEGRDELFVLGLISLSLALLNLLPLLPLDGGHIAFSLVEGIRGRAVGRPVYERASIVGLVFVLFLFAIGLTNDVGRLGGG
jgi:regulator of sigma E protease